MGSSKRASENGWSGECKGTFLSWLHFESLKVRKQEFPKQVDGYWSDVGSDKGICKPVYINFCVRSSVVYGNSDGNL